MQKFTVKENYTSEDLFSLVRALRDPLKGCPWDKEQTHESIRQNFIEETYEACEAIDLKDSDLLKEELGDVLLQVALHAEMESEKGIFNIDDVADGICKKLVLRHPHVFGDVAADSSDKVLVNWEAIKRDEKKQQSGTDAIEAVPKSLPALMRSQKVQKRAAYVGFDYPDTDSAFEELKSELEELHEAIGESTNIEEELGDLIFAAVNIARFCKIDAERALEKACDKFARRFALVEIMAAEEKIDMIKSDMDTLNVLWNRAKQNTDL
ncbi:MAG: nucleoside triphosphate pyrophosphohydrolase [Oscillospiraceae bacterium]